MTFDKLREKALGLPAKPGVYIMQDKTGKIIYVGKAKVLKNRVASYFHGEHEPKTQAMVAKINDFDVIVTGTEFEALVLENSLIKHHMPRYNILLRDDKGYPHIRVDLKSAYPSFAIVSRPGRDGARYLGPYASRTATKSALDAVLKAFMLPGCGKKFPRDIGRDRPCLNHHMGVCRAWCRPDAPQPEYREAVEAAVSILEGKTAQLAKKLAGEMEQAAAALQFERAADRRDRLRAVERLAERQFVVAGAMADTDVVGYCRGPVKSCFAVLHYIDGRLLDKDSVLVEDPIEEDAEALSGLLRQYYGRRGVLPREIYLPFEPADAQLLERLFTERAGHRVRLTVPQRGDKVRLVETAALNAGEEAARAATYEEKTTKTLQWLQNALKMAVPPRRIEAFDVSNTGASAIVASMTVFVDGRPLKRDYRKFKIKTTDTPDDYRSMAETVSRRVARYQSGDEKFARLPDLMLIDGGAAHAAGARRVLEEAGLSVPVFGMVKDDRHRTRALVSPEGAEIGIDAQPSAFAYIGTIQEETHRFAVEYHRQLRSKSARRSRLDGIAGVGEKRRNALLGAFGSIKAIGAATREELAAVVPKNIADAVYTHFHGESGG